jgi:hypothetical protein
MDELRNLLAEYRGQMSRMIRDEAQNEDLLYIAGVITGLTAALEVFEAAA